MGRDRAGFVDFADRHLEPCFRVAVSPRACMGKAIDLAGDFDYLRDRLAADEADEMTLGSPFDYETKATKGGRNRRR